VGLPKTGISFYCVLEKSSKRAGRGVEVGWNLAEIGLGVDWKWAGSGQGVGWKWARNGLDVG